MQLLKFTKRRRENETADRVALHVQSVWRKEVLIKYFITVSRCTVGVKFSSTIVASGDIQLGEITYAGDLHIIWSLYEVCTLDRSVWDQPCSVTGLSRCEGFEIRPVIMKAQKIYFHTPSDLDLLSRIIE